MTGIEMIAAERERQVIVKPELQDDMQLAKAACYYAMPGETCRSGDFFAYEIVIKPDFFFPLSWIPTWAQRDSKNRIQQLACAGALIAAEIDRLLADEVAR